MSRHEDAGIRCLVLHADGQGQCILCKCGLYHRPIVFEKLTHKATDHDELSSVSANAKPVERKHKSALTSTEKGRDDTANL